MELNIETIKELLLAINENRSAFVKKAVESNESGLMIRRLANTINDIAFELSNKYTARQFNGISDIILDNVDMIFLNNEKMRLISLSRNSVVGTITITNDNPKNVKIDYRQLFTNMLISNATKAIIIHNHPEGNCKPSEQDIKFTDVFKDLCAVFDITLEDHYVIATGGIHGILSNYEELFDEEDLTILRSIYTKKFEE